MPEINCNSSEEFFEHIYNMKSQNIEHLEKAMSFNVDLIKLLLEDVRCIPLLENVRNAILPCHHPTTLQFLFSP